MLNEREEFINQILGLINSAIEGVSYCIEKIKQQDYDACAAVLIDVNEVMECYCYNTERLKTFVPAKYLDELGGNALQLILDYFDKYNSYKFDDLQVIVEFTILPLLLELKEEINFFGLVYPDKEKMAYYYNNEYENANQNQYIKSSMETGEYKYPLSINVLAYNKLEYTRQCVEAILKYTDVTDYELILVNNGSWDGTREYFESIDFKNKKVINLKKNVGAMLASNICVRGIEGKYTFGISNDVIVTENYAKNLLACIQSDEKIGMVVPTTNCVSNNQAIKTTYKTIPEMQMFAKKYNNSNPDKWLERERLMPMMACINPIMLSTGLSNDRLFQFCEFCDDDISLRYRENGYKLILAMDTFVHHFGSVTLKEAQIKENTLSKSREIFKLKHGVDAWHSINTSSYIMNKIPLEEKQPLKILCIDAAFGAIPYRIINGYKENGNKSVKIYNFTTDSFFAKILENSFDECVLGDNALNITNAYETGEFDYIVFCQKLEEYSEIERLLGGIKTIIKPNGKLVFYTENAFNSVNIYNLLTYNPNFFDGNISKNFLLHTQLTELLKTLKYEEIGISPFLDSRTEQINSEITKSMELFGVQKPTDIDLHNVCAFAFSAKKFVEKV